MEQNKKKRMSFVIFFTIFLDLIGLGILIPVIPLLLADPSSKDFLLPAGTSIKNGFILLGFLTAIYPLGQFLAAPVLGQLSDKYGRKKVLVISLIGTGLSYILFAIGIMTKNIPLLFISRGLDGITGGNLSVAMASLTDITSEKDRAKTFGMIGAAFGLGFIIGPYIGGRLSEPNASLLFGLHSPSWLSATTPFYFAAILCFLNVISVLFFFQETLKNIRKDIHLNPSESIKNIIKAFKLEKLRAVFAAGFLFEAGFTFYSTFASVFFIQRFGFTQGNIGDFFAYTGIWIAITQIIIVPFAQKFKDYKVARYALIINGLATLLLFLPKTGWQLYLVVPIYAVFNGLCHAFLPVLASKQATEENQGEVIGLNASISALAQAIPAALTGYIAASLSTNSPLYVSTVIIALAGVVLWIFYKDNGMKNTNTANIDV